MNRLQNTKVRKKLILNNQRHEIHYIPIPYIPIIKDLFD